jgi:hypothetical protein
MRTVPIELLRGMLALLGVFFGYMLGRAAARYVNREGKPQVTGWAIRTLLVLVAVSWRGGLDGVTIAAILLTAIAVAAGYILQNRPKKPEDLTDVIFPRE